MRLPNCPNHGRQMLDLAQGRLDDRAAAEAEEVRVSCPVCSAWWDSELEGDLAASLDAAVAAGLKEFRPVRRRLSAWMPAAAAALLVVGAVAIWFGGHDVAITEPALTALVSESFDNDVNGDGVVDTSDLGLTVHIVGNPDPDSRPASDGEVIFADGLDSGDLSRWSSNT